MKKIFAVEPISAVFMVNSVCQKWQQIESENRKKEEEKASNFAILLDEIEAEFEKKESEKAAKYAANHKLVLTGTKPVLRRS